MFHNLLILAQNIPIEHVCLKLGMTPNKQYDHNMHTDVHTIYKLYQKGDSQMATTPAHLYLVHVNILREVMNWCCLLTSGCFWQDGLYAFNRGPLISSGLPQLRAT